MDNLSGTTGDDVFNAAFSGAGTALGGTTLNTGDTINGGAGNDKLSIVLSSSALGGGTGGVVVPNLKGVETIDVQAFGNGIELNLANSTGVETLSLTNALDEGGFQATNVGSLVDVELNNTTDGYVGVDYRTAVVSGKEDQQNIAVNASTGEVEVDGVETVTVTATGSNTDFEGNYLNLNGSAIKTVNVAGDGDLDLDLEDTVTTINASAATGDVDVTITGTQKVTATGGAGDDTFRFGSSFTKDDVVDGGEGEDTIVVEGSNFSATPAAAAFNALKSVERVEFQGTATTLNGATFTNTGITNLRFNTTGDDLIQNAGSARTYEFGAANAGNAQFDLAGATKDLNIALVGTDGREDVAEDGNTASVGNITVNLSGTAAANTVVTINLASSGDIDMTGESFADQDFNTAGVITAASGSTVNVTGEANLDIAGFTNAITVDASAFTGNLVIEGSESTTAADVITLGAGRDVVEFSSAADSGVISTATGAAAGTLLVDVINGFTTGADGDVLDFGGITSDVADYTALTATVQETINLLSGEGATLQAAADLAVAAAADDSWTAFTFQGQTYALYDAAGDATFEAGSDLLVQLTGVAVADLTDANFA